ncbi:ATP-binding protein [Hymenobacter sp. HD11105]
MRYFLLLVAGWLLLLSTSKAAQLPVDPAASQTTSRSGAVQAAAPSAVSYRYWETPPNFLRQVLSSQRADTARMRTLMHLADIGTKAGAESINADEAMELLALSARLGRPEQRAYRYLITAYQLAAANDLVAALDTAQAAVAAFDRLQRPVPMLLISMRHFFPPTSQEAKRTFYRAQLVAYRQRGDTLSIAACYHALAGYCKAVGDQNQAIGHYLQAAQYYRRFHAPLYYDCLAVAGQAYAEWGNIEKALFYLRQSLAEAGGQARTNPYVRYALLAQVQLQAHDYLAALRSLDQSIASAPPGDKAFRGCWLVLKSAVLLAQRRPSEALPLLHTAQQLDDSLHLPLVSSNGSFELAATWAQYYEAIGDGARAETHWLAAYRQAQQARNTPLRLAYLRNLARFYQQQRQPAIAATYAIAALGLSDTLSASQGRLHVTKFEIQQAQQAQTLRIADLRQAQALDAAQARRQRLLLGATLAVLALIGGLVFVLWRSNRLKQRANEQLNRLNAAVTTQKQELQVQRDQLDASLTELRTTQAQLIQKEKMASLGELTAGIAHEIQNPLNFVTNFSDVSAELMLELQEAQLAGDGEEVAALAGDVTENLTKIRQHGQRASSIVRGMLEHARASTGERTPTNLNALCEEYLRLAYQGQRTKDSQFEAEVNTDFTCDLAPVNIVAADVGRVLLNLYSNAFYAVQQRQQLGEAGYQPAISVQTKHLDGHVEIQVRDNGTGMSKAVQSKIFHPFFTTKPPGEGTGLGLSLSYDIIVQGHGGTLNMESKEGHGTEFTITLPV